MNIQLCTVNNRNDIASMIMELMNYHRKLTNAPKEFWCTLDASKDSFDSWFKNGKIYLLTKDNAQIGFFYIKFGGNNAAWLEDLYIMENYRGYGYGKKAMTLLDNLLEEEHITALFVDVIPRNTKAIEFYQAVGFDHLNMIQLRKNYDTRLNKDEDIELLGYHFKKY